MKKMWKPLMAVLVLVPAIAWTAAAQEQQDAEFVSMFDGKTLDGWHAVPADSLPDWSVEDGVIVGEGSVDRLVYLVYDDVELTDFELEASYRFPGNGNSGIQIHAVKDPSGKRPFVGYHADLGHVGIGPHILGAWDFHFVSREEYACFRGTSLEIDPDGTTHATEIEDPVTASDIARHGWNRVRVVARGRHYQFFINGKLASEFTDNANEERLDKGAIGLQIHDAGMRVEFKDLRLKKAASGNEQPTGRKPGVAGAPALRAGVAGSAAGLASLALSATASENRVIVASESCMVARPRMEEGR